LLPPVCHGLIVALEVQPAYAAGLMLLAASPGGVSIFVAVSVLGDFRLMMPQRFTP